MAESFFWNDVESLQCPPISRCPFSGDKGSVAVLTDQVVSMEMFLLKDPYLKFEESVLTRVLYKLSASLRRNKHYQYLKMIEKSLRKLSRLDLVTAFSHVTRCCPSSKDDSTGGAAVLLPSRQLLEFLLVKLLGAAEITSQTVSLCAEAFILTAQQITKSLFLAANCTLLSITSRLWALLKSFQEKLQQWYSFLRPWVDKLQGTQVQWLPGGVKLPLDLGEWIVPEEDTTQQQSRMQTSLSSVSPGVLGLLDHLFTSPVPSPDDRDRTTDPDASLNVDTTVTEKPVCVKKRRIPPVAQSTPVYNSPFLHPGEGFPSDLDMDLGEPVWSDISSIRNRLSSHVQENVVQPTKLTFGEDRGEGDLNAESTKSASKRKRQQTKKQAEGENLEDITHPAKRRKKDRATKEDETKETVQNPAKGKKRKAKSGYIQETQCEESKSQSTEEVEDTRKERTLHLPMEDDTPSKKKRKKKTKAKVTKDDQEDSRKPLNKEDDFRTETCKGKHLDIVVENPSAASTGKEQEFMVNASSTFEELYKCCQSIGEKVQEGAAEAKLQKLASKIKRCAKMESKGNMKVKFDLKLMKSKLLRLAQTMGKLEQSTLIQGSKKEVRNLKPADFKSLVKKRQDTTFDTGTESAKSTSTILSLDNVSMPPVVRKKSKQVSSKLLHVSDKKQDATVKKKKKSAEKGRVKKKKKSGANVLVKDDVLLKTSCSLNDTDEIDDIFRGLD
ncbi:PREDICTED: uncharacterized protein LOC109480382 [Branchiostoma belcheri]|uniref:Uncharacterized protein LOC109480382 n=1 Tax=Branchiostoma belcheri TaxID=7741 RepID=A0A6P5A4K7_BRABE|nr:PREDICTED: uncharacterized protein LOC109480382 [Branchiostoma belcheri]